MFNSHMFKMLAICCLLFTPWLSWASGGYDNGTPAGKGKIDIELTWNPFDIIPAGQSYIVWGYGLTDNLDFHGYYSHEAGGTDQIYYGLMYNFFTHKSVNLSTAVGLRHRTDIIDTYFPQLLYTIPLTQGFDFIGSIVNVYNITARENRGQTYDMALRIPIPDFLTPNFIQDMKLAVGAFRALSDNIYPTYSIDFRF